jgi:hypothetical protein
VIDVTFVFVVITLRLRCRFLIHFLLLYFEANGANGVPKVSFPAMIPTTFYVWRSCSTIRWAYIPLWSSDSQMV